MIFKSELLLTLDTVKALVLAASIGAPVFLINLLLSAFIGLPIAQRTVSKYTGAKPTLEEPLDEFLIRYGVLLCAVFSFLPLYLPILLKLFMTAMSFKVALTIAVVVEVVMIFVQGSILRQLSSLYDD